jgi:hypothetical protein
LSHGSGRGNGSGTSCSQVAIGCREASDRRADVAARRERGAGSQGVRGERESGVQVAADFERGELSEPGIASTGLLPVTLSAGCESSRGELRTLYPTRTVRPIAAHRITGAYQGTKKTNRNSLLDAFHLWCAEHNNCDFFLSPDFRLARMIMMSKAKPKVPMSSRPSFSAALQDEIWCKR